MNWWQTDRTHFSPFSRLQLGIALLITVASISSLQPLLLGKKHAHIRVETVAGFIEIIGLIFALMLAVVENSRSFHSSNVLLVFWPLVITSTAIKLRTELVQCPIDNNTHQGNDGIEECLVSVKLVLSVLVFALECVCKDAGIRLGQDMHVSFFFCSPHRLLLAYVALFAVPPNYARFKCRDGPPCSPRPPISRDGEHCLRCVLVHVPAHYVRSYSWNHLLPPLSSCSMTRSLWRELN